jgi:multicomponent Na+:H+ antiporter subunit D
MSSNVLLAVALLLPIAGALLIAATGKWPNVREAVTLSTAGLLFLSVLTIYSNLQGGGRMCAKP